MTRFISIALFLLLTATNVVFAAGTDVVDCDWCSSQSDFETAASFTAFSNPSGTYDVYLVNALGEDIWIVNIQIENPEQFISDGSPTSCGQGSELASSLG